MRYLSTARDVMPLFLFFWKDGEFLREFLRIARDVMPLFVFFLCSIFVVDSGLLICYCF